MKFRCICISSHNYHSHHAQPKCFHGHSEIWNSLLSKSPASILMIIHNVLFFILRSRCMLPIGMDDDWTMIRTIINMILMASLENDESSRSSADPNTAIPRSGSSAQARAQKVVLCSLRPSLLIILSLYSYANIITHDINCNLEYLLFCTVIPNRRRAVQHLY